jgi:hypothetical protein
MRKASSVPEQEGTPKALFTREKLFKRENLSLSQTHATPYHFTQVISTTYLHLSPCTRASIPVCICQDGLARLVCVSAGYPLGNAAVEFVDALRHGPVFSIYPFQLRQSLVSNTPIIDLGRGFHLESRVVVSTTIASSRLPKHTYIPHTTRSPYIVLTKCPTQPMHCRMPVCLSE